jgi:hypothetical protein
VLKPAADGVTLEIVTLEFPLLVNVTCDEPVLPTLMLPKLKLVGLAVKRLVAVAPVPLKPRALGELVALLIRERLPDTLPEAAGAKATVKLALCPAAMVMGKVRPLTENPVPERVSLETVRLAVPELVSVTV